MRFHQDDRGTRYCDIFPEIGKGDINITIIEPGAAALWHRHKDQTDYQFVIKGSLKVGVANLPINKFNYCYTNEYADNTGERMYEIWENEYYHIYKKSMAENSRKFNQWQPKEFMQNSARCDWFYLGGRNAKQGALFIPSGLWHGCYNYTNEPAILCYHITNKWDGKDEERCTPEVLGYDYERIVK